jgi:hypothetical protein
MIDKKAGDVIEAGEYLLFTSGEYSDFSVNGIYRAKKQFVMPGKVKLYGKLGELEPDTAAVSADPALVEEIIYSEIWTH